MDAVYPHHLLSVSLSVGDWGRKVWCSAASPWLRSTVAGEELLVGPKAVVLLGTVVVCAVKCVRACVSWSLRQPVVLQCSI